jgi:tripartite ATP-independent transporter DctM subunit
VIENPALICAAYVGLLIVLCLAGLHVATVMAVIGAAGALVFLGPPAVLNIGNLAWATSNEFLLISAPLFILMGELLLRSGVTDRMYSALAVWLGGIPGGLLHTNIASCSVFAAISGSSVATAATIGTVALPALRERGYSERLSLGSIVAGGTLGILIPPSVNMIIYGAMTDTSIGRLFAAGVIPGLLLALAFMGLIFAISVSKGATSARELRSPPAMGDLLRALMQLLPIGFVFLVVMGSLYAGFATPTESAALGVLAAAAVAWWYRRLTFTVLNESFRSTVRITGMVMLIIVAAFFLNFALSLIGLPQAITQWVKGLGISPLETIWLLFVVYLILGCFLETLSMMITTIPVVTPLVVALGFDPVWFGVFVVLMCELALITPPVGMNLFVVQGLRPPGADINDVVLGVLPFALVMMLMTGLLIHLPDLALWLPRQFFD